LSLSGGGEKEQKDRIKEVYLRLLTEGREIANGGKKQKGLKIIKKGQTESRTINLSKEDKKKELTRRKTPKLTIQFQGRKEDSTNRKSNFLIGLLQERRAETAS